MAKVLNPLLSTAAKGTVSGATYKSWRGINTALRKANPVARGAGVQAVNRATIGFFARNWGSLTQLQRDDWKDWAENHPIPDGFGGTFRMTGINAYVSLSQKAIVNIGGMPSLSAPTSDMANALMTFTLAAGVNPGEITANWTELGVPHANDRVVISVAGPFYSPGRKAQKKDYHTCWGTPGVNHAVAGNLLTYVLTGLVPSCWYWVRAHYVGADGQASAGLCGQYQAHA